MKIESEEIKGGKAKGMSLKNLAKKHKVDIKDIEKEIKVSEKESRMLELKNWLNYLKSAA